MPGQRGRGSRALRGSDGSGAQHGRPGGGAGGGNFRRRPAGLHGTELRLPGGRSLVSLYVKVIHGRMCISYVRRGNEGRGGGGTRKENGGGGEDTHAIMFEKLVRLNVKTIFFF